jgi:hypothetical protein
MDECRNKLHALNKKMLSDWSGQLGAKLPQQRTSLANASSSAIIHCKDIGVLFSGVRNL